MPDYKKFFEYWHDQSVVLFLIPKNVLLQAADRIEVLSGVRAASS